MRRKSAIIVAILIMCIGFAAISTTLIINGNAKVSENTDDFSVIFTSASLDGLDVYANVISQDKKTITFETKELKTLNDSSLLNYEVTNNSANYDAEVSVNCKVKENTTAKYTSIKNELEGNATILKAKESINGTLTITLNKTATEEVREEYVCTLAFNAVERNELGYNSVSFNDDSWELISKNIKSGKTDKYNVGDTKEIDMGDLGKHLVRISNMSECTNGEASETACGFVIEFADIITQHAFNLTNTNVGGWRDSELRSYINNTIYNSLSDELRKVIATTKVISSHGNTPGEINFETQDKLYLLNAQEIWAIGTDDTSYSESRQLDYYKNQSVTSTNFSSVVKQYNGTSSCWWLRSARSGNTEYTHYFLDVSDIGAWNYNGALDNYGVSPAFRIG